MSSGVLTQNPIIAIKIITIIIYYIYSLPYQIYRVISNKILHNALFPDGQHINEFVYQNIVILLIIINNIPNNIIVSINITINTIGITINTIGI